uniref:Phorbol-ester/DAG-type domain-containing protein n=1 Tax=Erpetoichthys calabaricus TaxID=27687 RepID=A0A8C4SXX4_ERPCA
MAAAVKNMPKSATRQQKSPMKALKPAARELFGFGKGVKKEPQSEPPAAAIEGTPAHRGRKKGFRAPDVRTIFVSAEKDPRVRLESGEGHCFTRGAEQQWCDVCCQLIVTQSLRCTECNYTCHPQCRDKVKLDCNSNGKSMESSSVPDVEPDNHNNKLLVRTCELRCVCTFKQMLTGIKVGPSFCFVCLLTICWYLAGYIFCWYKELIVSLILYQPLIFLPFLFIVFILIYFFIKSLKHLE